MEQQEKQEPIQDGRRSAEIPLTIDWSMKSSQVARTTYNEQAKEMTVQFKSKGNPIWVYSSVTPELWIESTRAVSIGKFLNVKIKPNCPARKIS